MKITSYASKSIADFSTIELRQHFFLSSSISTAGFPPASLPITGPIQAKFQQLAFSKLNGALASTPFYHRPHTDQHFNNWLSEINGNFASTPSYHRSIQVNIWPFSAGITPRRQHHMEVFDDFHIEEYFHLFSFMGWILNFISIHPINGMNKWSILIIYSFMK